MNGRVTVLTGGVGGAKLVLGLTRILPPDKITAIINTGDDFRHVGLWISPDIDTLLYTLSGRSNQDQGWGRANEEKGRRDCWSSPARKTSVQAWFKRRYLGVTLCVGACIENKRNAIHQLVDLKQLPSDGSSSIVLPRV